MLKHIITTALIATSACVLLLFPQLSVAAVSKSLNICAQSIIPSLFPFMVLTDFWITSGGADYIGHISDKWMRSWFRMPGTAATALICGAVGGFPTGAKTISTLYADKRLTKEQGDHLLFFCSNAGPAFIFGVIGASVFQRKVATMLLWSIHLISALLLGVIFRPRGQHLLSEDPKTLPTPSKKGDLVNSITNAGNDIMRICTFIILFSIVVTFIDACTPTILKTSFLSPLLFGVIELAGSTAYLHHIPQHIAFILLSVLLAWNGICVHLQVGSILENSGLSMKKYFAGKLMHMLLSLSLAMICAPWVFEMTIYERQIFNRTNIIVITAITIFILTSKTSYGKKVRVHI